MSTNDEISKSDEKYIMDHEYDGIQEFNYPLPTWWVATFWGGLIFGIGYIAYFIFMSGPSLRHEYFMDREKINSLRTHYLTKLSEFDEEQHKRYIQSPDMKSYGEAIYNQNCKSCHNALGSGDIGPNLTDPFWLYTEGTPGTMFSFILEGNPANGMPAWAEKLDKDDLYAVVAYVMSLQGIQHIQAKGPQGEQYPLYKLEN